MIQDDASRKPDRRGRERIEATGRKGKHNRQEVGTEPRGGGIPEIRLRILNSYCLKS